MMRSFFFGSKVLERFIVLKVQCDDNPNAARSLPELLTQSLPGHVLLFSAWRRVTSNPCNGRSYFRVHDRWCTDAHPCLRRRSVEPHGALSEGNWRRLA